MRTSDGGKNMRTTPQLAAPLFAIGLGIAAAQFDAVTRDAAAGQAPPKKTAAPSVQMTLEIENEDTHVWKMHLPPKQTSNFHRHNHPRVVVALTGGSPKLLVKGAEARTLPWQSGKAYWLPADNPGEYHAYLNDGDRPIEFIYIEFERSK
jgi:quercetin dioxygenase-like cupin family protein